MSEPGSSAQPVELRVTSIQPGREPGEETAVGTATLSVQQVFWQGQYPPPDAVERYEAVNPGTFDRLIALTERHQQESFDAKAEGRRNQRADNQRGQYLGFAVTVLALGGAVGCALMGHDWIAAAMVGVPVLSVARALVQSARSKVAPNAYLPAQPPENDQPTLPPE